MQEGGLHGGGELHSACVLGGVGRVEDRSAFVEALRCGGGETQVGSVDCMLH